MYVIAPGADPEYLGGGAERNAYQSMSILYFDVKSKSIFRRPDAVVGIFAWVIK